MAKKKKTTAEPAELVKLGFSPESSPQFCDTARAYLGQKVAVMCVRYQYRGILSIVGEDHLVLANPTAIEVSGPSQTETPSTEDAIGCSVVIKTDAVELLYQPQWCFSPLPNEEGFQARSQS